jgi:anhydro-N-acetylmuramic acid kinase
MVYRVIGVMSGSSLDGLDIAFATFQENAGKWTYEIKNAVCYNYTADWIGKLKQTTSSSAKEYQLLHAAYGHYLGEQINRFIEENNLQYQVALISSHGHTTFHLPSQKMTAQLGDGSAIAAETQLPVVTDLRSLDVAFGGQGAPIVPVGEKLLLGDYDYFLNLGGIANISINAGQYSAFDVCPANRVLNMLANDAGKEFDDGGGLARNGNINEGLLQKLNALNYYQQAFPKSLANEFGTDVVYPLIRNSGCVTTDGLRTYVEHIVIQVREAINQAALLNRGLVTEDYRLLVTGGGAFNTFLMERLKEQLKDLNIAVIVPDENLVKYKEALIMAFIGVLRWRQEYNVLSSVTGATRDSIGGALWIGQEA